MKSDQRAPAPCRKALRLAATALLCAAVCVGCSSSPSDTPAQCLRFLHDEGIELHHVVSRTGADSVCNFLVVDLIATEIQGIRSAELQIAYPNGLALLLTAEVGPLFLGTPGETVDCDLALAQNGVFCELGDNFEDGTAELDISLTSQTDWTVDAPLEGAVLARLTFVQLTTLSGAQGSFQFNYGKLLDDGNLGTTNPVDIINVATDPNTFVGGQMIIAE